jgi:hypothetical protein
MYNMYNSDNNSNPILTFIVVGAIALVVGTLRLTTYVADVPCTVVKAENVRTGTGNAYRLFCKQETFDIKDDWLTGRFRSSDMYGSISNLSKGSEISLDVWGIRFGPTNSTRTVIDWSK